MVLCNGIVLHNSMALYNGVHLTIAWYFNNSVATMEWFKPKYI